MYNILKMTVNIRLRTFLKNVWEKVVVGKALPTTVHFLKKYSILKFLSFL